MKYLNKIIDSIADYENINWAWEKAKEFYRRGEFWCDQIAYAKFTANYEKEIEEIRNNILKGNYKLTPLKPIFFPKGSENNDTKNRQMFWVAIRDQVTWLAVLNIIGQFYDQRMPFWSYGHRLYISMFPKTKTNLDKITWGYGPYRNTRNLIYRNFSQSWPRFRRDIYITEKLLTKRMNDLSEEEMLDIEENKDLPSPHPHKVLYKTSEFWGDNQNDAIYWCNLDIKKFYPSAKTFIIKNNIQENFSYLPNTIIDLDKFSSLLDSILKFEIDQCGFSEMDLKNKIDVSLHSKHFDGIPTGLFAAGFLSNIAMLRIDNILHNLIIQNSQTENKIALFRFVDDFTILSKNFNSLIDFIDIIKKLINEEMRYCDGKPCMELNLRKTKPNEFYEYLSVIYHLYQDKKECLEVNKTNEIFCKDLIEYYNTNELHKICSECQISNENLCKYLFGKFHDNDQNNINLKYKKTINRLKEKAEAACKLDPEFPSPLMNLTLEKISLVNRTPFDILDESEEEQLITDLEHLLISDLSDEEIRRDTRMSFASSRLAAYVPQMSYDSSSFYKIKSLKNKKAYIRKEINKIKNCKGRNEVEKREELKDEILELIVEISKLNKEGKQLSDSNNAKIRSTYTLLKRAINDYPDKIKLWRNAIYFCERTGYQGLGELFNLVKTLRKLNKINDFTELYIITYMCDVLIKSLMKIARTTLDDISYQEEERRNNFIEGILTPVFLSQIFEYKKVINSKIYYVRQTIDLLRIMIGSFLYSYDIKAVLNKDSKKIEALLNKYHLIKWCENPRQYIESKMFELDDIVWWLTSGFINISKRTPPKFVLDYMDKLLNRRRINIRKPTALSVLTLFPENISKYVLCQLIEYDTKTFLPITWWNIVGNKNENYKTKNMSNFDFQNKNYRTYIKISKKYKGDQEFITIGDFINCKDNTEITALKVTLEIVEVLIEKFALLSPSKLVDFEKIYMDEENYIGNIINNFPYNIRIRKNLGAKENVKFSYYEDICIKDTRYIPNFNSGSINAEKQKIIYGIGILLIQLVAKESELPINIFLPGQELLNEYYLYQLLKEKPISCYSLEIINSCISKKKRETKYLLQLKNTLDKIIGNNNIFWFEIEDETLLIGDDLNKLKMGLNNSINRLEECTYSYNRSTRYLIPISLSELQETEFIQEEENV